MPEQNFKWNTIVNHWANIWPEESHLPVHVINLVIKKYIVVLLNLQTTYTAILGDLDFMKSED
jgi:hypothetical protein